MEIAPVVIGFWVVKRFRGVEEEAVVRVRLVVMEVEEVFEVVDGTEAVEFDRALGVVVVVVVE